MGMAMSVTPHLLYLLTLAALREVITIAGSMQGKDEEVARHCELF